MDTRLYDIIFSGDLVAGRDPAQVRSEFARLFKVDPAAIEHLFRGRPVIIKKGLDRQTADKYKAALERVGAVCELRMQAVVEAAPAEKAEDGSTLTIAPVGVVLTASREVPRPEFDLGRMSLAPPGADLREGVDSVVVVPSFDLSTFSIAPPGIELIGEKAGEPVRLPDPGDMTMDEPGADLDTRAPPPAAPLPDISGITLAPPGTAVLRSGEAKPLPVPPDTSNPGLTLEAIDGPAA